MLKGLIKSILAFIKLLVFGRKDHFRHLFWSSTDDNIYLGEQKLEAAEVTDLIEAGHIYFCDRCQSHVTELSEEDVNKFLILKSMGAGK